MVQTTVEESETVTKDGREYPIRYAPAGVDSDLDRAWEIVDAIPDGVLSTNQRSFLCGLIVGVIMKTRGEERKK
jgi:hypothetical protein